MENGDWSWETEWGQISPDGHFRFDYKIRLSDSAGGVDVFGLCRVELLDDDAARMSGPYFKISPLNKDSEFTEWGTITFTKLDRGSALERPEYDGSGFEK